MADMCGDNRFEIIAKAKKALLEGTNIETDKDEMKVIDNILFRCWQMGWLDRYDKADTPQTDCDKCIWSACNYNKVDWGVDTPQTDIYPLTIVMDRYGGIYSGGCYTAWNLDVEDVPQEIESDDVTCYDFWHSYDGIVGLGTTPSKAAEDLRRKLEKPNERGW